MTSTDINELRDFISGELDKVHVRLDEVHVGLDEVRHFISGELDKVHVRLDEVHVRLDGVREDQARLEALSARHFASIESRFGGVESRLTRVEIIQEAMRSDFRVFGEDLRSTNRRLDDLREDMNRRSPE